MYTRGEYVGDVAELQHRKARLRTIFTIGQVEKNIPQEWKIDGLLYKKLDDEIDREIQYCRSKMRMQKLNYGERMQREQDHSDDEVGRQLWNRVDRELAIKLAQAGFSTRYIGLGWEVRSR